jgi:uncharacterized membrane protein YczE
MHRRLTVFAAGVLLLATGIAFTAHAGLGLSSWEVLNQGVARSSPLTLGAAGAVVGVALVGLAHLLGARFGFATIATPVLTGVLVDVVMHVDAVADIAGAAPGVRALATATGIVLIALGTSLYIAAGLGAGPRDSIMVRLARITKLRIGRVRTGLELTVTLAGFALGGTVGVGTLAAALAIGPAVEWWMRAIARSPWTAEVPSAA